MLPPLKFIRLIIVNMAVLLQVTSPGFATRIHTQREIQELQDQAGKEAAVYQGIINKIFDKNTRRQMTVAVEAQKDLVEDSLQKSKVDPRAKVLAALNRGNSSRCSLNQDCARKDPILNSMKHNTASSDSQPLVFVSSSMPITALQELALDARKQGARLIIRGMVNNSMKETGNLAKDINYSLDIDPKLFKKFDVGQVPTFVLPYENKGVREWRVIRGNITLTYALEKAAGEGFGASNGEASANIRKVQEAHP